MTLLLRNSDVKQIIDMDQVIASLSDVYLALGRDEAAYRKRTDLYARIATEEDYFLLKTMEGVYPAKGVAALRLTSDVWRTRVVGGAERFERTSGDGAHYVGLVLLFSMDGGRVEALLHGAVMQQYRVGATQALGSKILARPDSSTVAVLGSGGQARSNFLAATRVHSFKKALVFSPTVANRVAYADEMSRLTGVDMVPVATAREAVESADVVISATSASEPTIEPDWIRPGTHIWVVQNQEVSQELVDRADIIGQRSNDRPIAYAVKDDVPRAISEIEDRTFADAEKRHRALPDLLAGTVAGRTDESQITLFGMVTGGPGMGLEFAAVGSDLVTCARERGLGQELPDDIFHEEERG